MHNRQMHEVAVNVTFVEAATSTLPVRTGSTIQGRQQKPLSKKRRLAIMGMLELLLVDERLQRLAALSAAWSFLWTLCLHAVPAGASGRDHIVALNAAHGVVCTLTATATLVFGLETANSVAVSLGFFLVDLAAMLKADGLLSLNLNLGLKMSKLKQLHRSRVMDYAHHWIGIFWGLVFFAHERTVCGAELGNPYVWIQTNEVSTGFYNWFRLTNSPVAGALFASSFFLSRIAFNSAYFVPRLLRECDRRYLLGCLPYFALQYAWFAMIVRKLARSRSRPSSSSTRSPGSSSTSRPGVSAPVASASSGASPLKEPLSAPAEEAHEATMTAKKLA